jgi:hypothetical protein
MDILQHDWDWAHGIRLALKAYTRASDAYENVVSPSVALWAVLIAAGIVLVEWLVAVRKAHE